MWTEQRLAEPSWKHNLWFLILYIKHTLLLTHQYQMFSEKENTITSYQRIGDLQCMEQWEKFLSFYAELGNFTQSNQMKCL